MRPDALLIACAVVAARRPGPAVLYPSDSGKANLDDPELAASRSISNHTIWMFWKQGEANLSSQPAESKYANDYACFQGWKKLNPTWDVRLLDDDEAAHLAPGYARERDRSAVQAPLLSDLLRLELLSRYGGVWADVSACPVESLDTTLTNEVMGPLGFFTYHLKNAHSTDESCVQDTVRQAVDSRYTVTWFLAVSKPEHWLINAWHDELQSLIAKITPKDRYPYFLAHCALAQVRLDRPLVRDAIDALAQFARLELPAKQLMYKGCTRWDMDYASAVDAIVSDPTTTPRPTCKEKLELDIHGHTLDGHTDTVSIAEYCSVC